MRHSVVLVRATLLLALGYGLTLPLRDLLAYPDRVSVLPNLQTDAAAYYNIGRAIAEQRSLDAFPIRHPPGWIALLALVFSVAGVSFVAAKLISWIALVVSVIGCAGLARRIYGPTAGWIAALLVSTSPALRGYVGTVQYEVFTGTLLVALVILAVRAADSPDRDRWRRVAWVGGVGAVLILTRETFAVVVPLVGIWIGHRIAQQRAQPAAVLAARGESPDGIRPTRHPHSTPPRKVRAAGAPGWLRGSFFKYGPDILSRRALPPPPHRAHYARRGPRSGRLVGLGARRAFRHGLLALTVSVIAIAPAVAWSAMQSVRSGTLVTISEKGPIVIELGHNTRANGTYNAPLVGIGQPTGIAFVLQNPGREVVLSGRKVLYFWGVLRDGWNVPRPAAVWLWRATTGIVPYEVFAALARGGWLLALFLMSLWMLGRAGLTQWWGIPGVVITLMVVHIITLSSHRFAVPGLPLVFVLVSGPLAAATEQLRLAFRSRAVVIAATLLIAIASAMQFQYWPLQMRLHAADLDGLLADNVADDDAGHPVRIADAARGVRPVALLSDHFFARGTIRVTLAARALAESSNTTAPAVRMSLVDLNGDAACAADVTGAELPTDRFAPIAMTCRLPADKVATLAVFSLGVVDFALDELSLEWVQ